MLTNLKEKQEKRKSHYCFFVRSFLFFCRLMHGLDTTSKDLLLDIQICIHRLSMSIQNS